MRAGPCARLVTARSGAPSVGLSGHRTNPAQTARRNGSCAGTGQGNAATDGRSGMDSRLVRVAAAKVLRGAPGSLVGKDVIMPEPRKRCSL
jgi:hypothetical protein